MGSRTNLEDGRKQVDKTLASSYRFEEVPDEALTDPVIELFESYSHIPRNEVKRHILNIVSCAVIRSKRTKTNIAILQRDQAWNIFPWPCVGRCTFVELSVGNDPHYAEVLSRLKAGEKYLDAGCCFGQDIRKLVYDGVPSENLTGTDLESRFFPLGHKLFNDEESLRSQFIAADFIDTHNVSLDHLKGCISIIHASSFFHVFDYAGQVAGAKRCIELLKPQPGCLIFGRQGAREQAGEKTHPALNWTYFVHNAESWKRMWSEVGEATGTKWEVEVDMNAESPSWLRHDGRQDRSRMRYACRLL